LLSLAIIAAGCGVHRRVMGILGEEEGTLLVRHHEAVAQEIRADTLSLGVALPGAIACFRNVPAGPLRLEARASGSVSLTRAVSIVLTPERPLLWDIDHSQVVDGRAYQGLCE
jgi:hypothetical protein